MKRSHLLVALLLIGLGFLLGRATRSVIPESVGRAEQKQSTPKKLPPDDGKLRIICFGAHPDDCELRAGGVAAMWAAAPEYGRAAKVIMSNSSPSPMAISDTGDRPADLSLVDEKPKSSRSQKCSVSPRRSSTFTMAS